MIWALLPLLLLSFIMGITAVEHDLASTKPPAAPQTIDEDAAGQEFMAYRNAVIAFAQALMGTNIYPYGPIPNSLLGLSSSVLNALPSGASNLIAIPLEQLSANIIPSAEAATNHGYYVCVWMPMSALDISQTASQLGGDLTIGTVLTGGMTWQQAGPQGQTLAIPRSCLLGLNASGLPNIPPAGDIISVVGITENTPSTNSSN